MFTTVRAGFAARATSALVFVSTLAATAAPALAESEFEAQIEARKGIMTYLALNLGPLGGMAKGTVDYDPEAAAKAAANLAAASHLDMSMLFPEGSDQMSTDETRALPAIWESMEDVGAKKAALVTAADALAAAAGTDLAALQAAIGPVGEACGACHKLYRAPE